MMDEEDKNVSVENKKAKKIFKGLLIVLIVSIIVSSCIGLGLMFTDKLKEGKQEDKKEESTNNEEKNENIAEEDIFKDYVIDNDFSKISEIPDEVKLYAVDVNSGNDDVKASGYDGYYLISEGNDFYLKRNQKEVAKIERNALKVYKDNSDENSKYIAVYCGGEFGFCSFSTAVNSEYAYLSVFNSNYKNNIIFNVNTGKYKIYEDGKINPISGIDDAIFTYESNTDYTISIVSLDDFSLKKPKDVKINGDSVRLGQGDGFSSNSTKYIVVKNAFGTESGKYGLYDYQGNKKIDLIYDDLNTISDDLLIAKKGEKFGVVDSSNKTIIDFIYDGIEFVDNYYVVIKDGKLGVIDKDGKEVVPFNYNVPKDMKFNLRLCCGDSNSFDSSKKGDKILISYYDADRVLEGYRYGHDISYIILNKDGSHSKVDYNNKIYNYSEEFYYYSNSGNDLNIYDSNRNIYKTFTCTDVPFNIGFVNKDILRYSCDTEEHYYNIKLDKEVTKEDVKELEKEYASFLYIYTIDGIKGVYSNNNKLLLELDNNEVFRHVHDNIYKLIRENGFVEYYQLENLNLNF